MLLLKSYVCYKCNRGIQDVERGKEKREFGKICTKYGRFGCYACYSAQPWDIDLKRFMYSINVIARNLNIIARAPEEEIKLLDFGKWSPFHCAFCYIKIVDMSQVRVYKCEGLQGIYCATCYKDEEPRNELLENLWEKLLLEMKPYFKSTISEPTKRTRLELKSLDSCFYCRRRFFDGKVYNGSEYFDEDGEIVCGSCKVRGRSHGKAKTFKDFFVGLHSFLNYVADPADLALLTYSKWVDLRCSSCCVEFSSKGTRLPMFRFDSSEFDDLVCKSCSVSDGNKKMTSFKLLARTIDELRGYFKKEQTEAYRNVDNNHHRCVAPLLSGRSFGEDASTEVDVTKEEDIADSVVNFDELSPQASFSEMTASDT